MSRILAQGAPLIPERNVKTNDGAVRERPAGPNCTPLWAVCGRGTRAAPARTPRSHHAQDPQRPQSLKHLPKVGQSGLKR
eukprot:2989195-Alexandrium_andersonii.AAC.1